MSDLICPNCQMGRLDLRLTTYLHVYGETLISMSNMPAWVCDICHMRQFDTDSIRRIELLITQEGLPPNRYQPRLNQRSERGDTQATRIIKVHHKTNPKPLISESSSDSNALPIERDFSRKKKQ